MMGRIYLNETLVLGTGDKRIIVIICGYNVVRLLGDEWQSGEPEVTLFREHHLLFDLVFILVFFRKALNPSPNTRDITIRSAMNTEGINLDRRCIWIECINTLQLCTKSN